MRHMQLKIDWVVDKNKQEKNCEGSLITHLVLHNLIIKLPTIFSIK